MARRYHGGHKNYEINVQKLEVISITKMTEIMERVTQSEH